MNSQMKTPPASYGIGICKNGYNASEVRRFLRDKATDITAGRYHWRDAMVLEPENCSIFLFCVSGKLFESENPAFWCTYGRHLEDGASRI